MLCFMLDAQVAVGLAFVCHVLILLICMLMDPMLSLRIDFVIIAVIELYPDVLDSMKGVPSCGLELWP